MKIASTGIQAFAHAAALDKDGRLSNTIYCEGKDIFILNQDNSVLIRFQFSNQEFEHSVCFRAEDYDSNELYEKDGKIVFVQKSEEWVREKSCRTPGRTPGEVRQLWKSLRFPRGPKIHLSSSILPLLDSSLSHIEFSVKKGKFQLCQKNIYTGVSSQMEKAKSSMMGSGDELGDKEYGPIGMRTGDFMALFSFCEALEITFPKDPMEGYFYVNGPKVAGLPSNLQAFVCMCIYDELGDIQYLLKQEDSNGGKEQEERRSEQGVDRKIKTRTKSRNQ